SREWFASASARASRAARGGTFCSLCDCRIKTCHRGTSKMKIAQIAPLMESVPPRLYGGTERVVSHLCEALVRKGHQVTLFASGDSITSADLVPCTTEAIRLNPAVKDYVPHYMIMLDKVRRTARRFDVLHFHIDAFHMPLFNDIGTKTLTTLHGRQDLPHPAAPLSFVSEHAAGVDLERAAGSD